MAIASYGYQIFIIITVSITRGRNIKFLLSVINCDHNIKGGRVASSPKKKKNKKKISGPR
jgi:hypothetical protein